MYGKIQARLAVVAALAALAALLVPAGLAAGSHEGDPPVIGAGSVVLLNLGSVDNVTWDGPDGAVTQSISTHRTKCTPVIFGSDPQLLDVSAGGGDLGIVKDGLGVKSQGDGNSGPCGLAEAADGESIAVSLGSSLQGYLMNAIDVDLELKHGSVVRISFLHGSSTVASIDFDPTDDADDGPDSGDGDNYRFNSQTAGVTGEYFDSVVFTALEGDFSLEAGADGTADGALDDNNSSQFAINRAFEGVLDCFPDTADIGTAGVDTTYGTVVMHAQDAGDGWSINDCILKPFDSETAAAALGYFPELTGVAARYTIDVTVEDQPLTVDGDGNITSLGAEYDPTTGDLSFPMGPTRPLQACAGQPVLLGDSPTPAEEAAYLAFWTGTGPTDLMPSGESACFYSASVTPTSAGFGTEHWSILFFDDPGFRFK